jgi:hypothetical protein
MTTSESAYSAWQQAVLSGGMLRAPGIEVSG